MSHNGERSDDDDAKASIIEALSSDQSRFMVCESGFPSQSHGFRAFGKTEVSLRTSSEKTENSFSGEERRAVALRRTDRARCVTGGGSFDVIFGRVLQLRAVSLQSIADLIARHGAIYFRGDGKLRMCHPSMLLIPRMSQKFDSFNAGESGSSHKYLSLIFFTFYRNCDFFFLLRYCQKKKQSKNQK